MDKIRVLLIEDEKMIAENLKSVIENFGYEVVDIVDTAEDALEVAFDTSIDIVVSDIEIRGLTDGIEVSKILQNTYNLPIIFTTAYNDEEKIKRASDVVNMVGYLVKPIRIDELDTMIKIAITKYQILEKRKMKDINNIYKYDFTNKKIFEDDKEIVLTRNESILLSLLVNSMGDILSYDAVNTAIWKDKKGSDVARRQLIHRLKSKLEKIDIASEKGVGIYIKEKE
ncbi:response regulator [Arcobacter roscoffensis]|uniref:Response regulator n=1 Tax=Arcobacter roscoffensis TaxID=2961520 RepID=A0ABY5E7N7_9BACT|nr:response regulator [Arcobacter roscoffensis]UTJ07539.1 response regulator [Arcobacter roscoffensis]